MSIVQGTLSDGSLHAQNPNWQPHRLPNNNTMQPLNDARNHSAASQHLSSNSAGSAAQSTATNSTVGSGVVLRWRASAKVNATAPTSSGISAAALLDDAHTSSSTSAVRQASSQQPITNTTDAHTASSQNQAWSNNPLRTSGASQSVARQTQSRAQAATSDASSDRAVRLAAYQAPEGNAAAPQAVPPTLLPMPNDPLVRPELAPPPPGSFSPEAINPSTLPGSPNLPPTLNLGAPDPVAPKNTQPQPNTPIDPPGPFDRRSPDAEVDSPSDRTKARDEEEDPTESLRKSKRSRPDSTANCEAFRDQLRNSTLDKIDLNSAPRYGQGLMLDDEKEAEKLRREFETASKERDWCDREGRTLIRGRLLELRNEQVVLDVQGARREIPLRDLCDVDLAYVGKVWNLPISCGLGYDQIAGRNFVPSAMQWHASALCHKPLYFEEVQLERYGHEIGPVLQPVVSTVHFFGNIAVLPYKMGIHPPQECQYALGYYRPGDCAPYMIPPIPYSLRGAAMQAGAVVTAAALVP